MISIVLLVIVVIIYRNICNINYINLVYKCYEKCLSNNSSINLKEATKSFKYGKDLWNYYSHNKNKICKLLKQMNLKKINMSYYYHRLYNFSNFQSKINLSGKFPHISYYRLVPHTKRDYQNVITDTYKVQDYIFDYQHPISCENKKYLIIRGYNSGHGSELHVITSYLSLAITLNRIAIFDPYYKSFKAIGKFCQNVANWLCFIEQITNCSLSHNSFINSIKFVSINQTEKYLYINNYKRSRKLIPKGVINIVSNSPIYKNKLLHYWRIQAITYIFR